MRSEEFRDERRTNEESQPRHREDQEGRRTRGLIGCRLIPRLIERLTASAAIRSPRLDEHIFTGPSRVDRMLETNVKTVMTLVQHTSTTTMDTGGIACEYLRSPSRL